MAKGEQQEMGAQKAGQRVEFSPVSSGELLGFLRKERNLVLSWTC